MLRFNILNRSSQDSTYILFGVAPAVDGHVTKDSAFLFDKFVYSKICDRKYDTGLEDGSINDSREVCYGCYAAS